MFGRKKKLDSFFNYCESKKSLYMNRNAVYGKEVRSLENGYVLTSRRTNNDYIVIKYDKVGGGSFAFEGFVPDYGYSLVKVDTLEDGTNSYSGFISDSGRYEAIDDKNFETGIYCVRYLEKEFENSITVDNEQSL